MDPKQATILLIEDEPINAEMYSLKFKLEGLKIVVAQTADEGLKSVKEIKPDIILLDLKLDNGKDGFEVLKQIKSNEDAKTTPVYLLSNMREKGNREKGAALGAEGFISKVNTKLDEVIRIVVAKIQTL